MLKTFKIIKEFIAYKKKNTVKKLKPNKNLNYKLLIIDDESDNLYTVLGITEDRADEITEFCFKAYQKQDKFSMAIKDVSEIVVHQNELIFASLMLAKMHSKPVNNPIQELLRKLNDDNE
jgi:Mg2+ and Co2+ transporter CorA